MSGFNNNQGSQYGSFGDNDGLNSGSPSKGGASGGPAPSSGNGNNQGIPNKGAFANMTERERQALIAVRDKVTIMRRVGAVGGAAITYALLRRRKPTPNLGATIGFTILGSIAGGGLLMPAGVMWGKADMQNVEDPSHFARVLQGAADERRGRIAPGVAQDGTGNGPSGQSNRPQQFGQQPGSSLPSFPPPSQSTRRTPQPSPSNNRSNQWGDDSFDESVLYGSQSQSASFPSSSGQYSENTNSSPSSSPNEPSQPQSSRWAQIRGDRSAQPSSWDRLRQQNAREVYEKRNAGAGQEKEMNNVDAQYGRSNIGSSTGSLADPSFGKGTSTSRAQAQREYEASFDRERRGIDG